MSCQRLHLNLLKSILVFHFIVTIAEPLVHTIGDLNLFAMDGKLRFHILSFFFFGYFDLIFLSSLSKMAFSTKVTYSRRLQPAQKTTPFVTNIGNGILAVA